MSEEIPEDIMKMVLAIGKADWSASAPMDTEEHIQGYRDLLAGTTINFGTAPTDKTVMHGLITVETPFPLSLATVGDTPNSPTVARALCGAWNLLVDMCREQQLSSEANVGGEAGV